MRRLSRCACAMTLEMPEIDSKGQSAHLCFYRLNAFYFPVILFYSVDACPPQRTYVFLRCDYILVIFRNGLNYMYNNVLYTVNDRCSIELTVTYYKTLLKM
jgi:hypothetical protein